MPAVLTPSYITTPSTDAVTTFYVTWQSEPFIGAPATWRGSWDSTFSVSEDFALLPYRGGREIISFGRSEATATTPFAVALGRGIIGPLAAQTVGGTLNVIAGVRESNADADMYWKVYAYVTVGQTDTVRGVLLDWAEDTTNEWPTTATAVQFQSPQTMSNVVAEQGDQIIVEVGYVARNATATSRTGTMWFGAVDADGAVVPALTAGDTNVTEECGTGVFGTAVTLLANPPVTNDLIASNEVFYIFDSETGLLKRIVIPPGAGIPPEPTGGAQFATDGNLFFAFERFGGVMQFDPSMSEVVSQYLTSPGTLPHSMAVNRDQQYYVGHSGDGAAGQNSSCGMEGTATATAVTGALRKYNASGTLLAVYNPDLGASGTNAIDLSRDQARMFYTSLDATIRVFNEQTNAQEDDFATVPGGVMLRGIRILPDEGVIVAHEAGLTRLDSTGAVVQTYTVTGGGNWGTVALSSNGAVVWGANTAWEAESGFPPMIAKWGVESGAVMLKITENVLDTTGNLCSGGLNIWNEYRDSITGPPPVDEESDDILGEAQTYPIRWVRRTPVLSQENLRVFVSKLTLDIQTGVGLSSGQGSDPVVMFRYSIDGGYQWSNERQLSVGAIGMYLTQVQTWRLGYGRQWVFEFSGSDPVTLGLLDLYFTGDVGDS